MPYMVIGHHMQQLSLSFCEEVGDPGMEPHHDLQSTDSIYMEMSKYATKTNNRK